MQFTAQDIQKLFGPAKESGGFGLNKPANITAGEVLQQGKGPRQATGYTAPAAL